MSILNPDAGWPDIDGINTNERLLGGENGPLNRAPSQLTARTKQLRLDVDALRADVDPLLGGDGSAALGFTQAGAGAIARDVQGKLREWVTPEDFGAVGANTQLGATYATLAAAQAVYPFVTALTQTQDWAAIQAAVNTGAAVAGQTGRTYYLSDPVAVVDADLYFVGRQCRVVSLQGLNPAFSAVCTYGAQVAVSAITNGTYDFTGGQGGSPTPTNLLTVASVAGFSVGDVVKIISDDLIEEARPADNERKGEHAIVGAISGSQLVLYSYLFETYATNIRVARMNSAPRVLLSDFTSDFTAGGSAPAILIQGAFAPEVLDVKAPRSRADLVRFISCVFHKTRGIRDGNATTDFPNSAYGYTIVEYSCEYGLHSDLQAYQVRHAYTDGTLIANAGDVRTERYGRTKFSRIADSEAWNCQNAGFDTHWSSFGIEFNNCAAYAPFNGPNASARNFQLRGRAARMNNCTSYGGIGLSVFQGVDSALSCADNEVNNFTHYFARLSESRAAIAIEGVTGSASTIPTLTVNGLTTNQPATNTATFPHVSALRAIVRLKRGRFVAAQGGSAACVLLADTLAQIYCDDSLIDARAATGTNMRVVKQGAASTVRIQNTEILGSYTHIFDGQTNNDISSYAIGLSFGTALAQPTGFTNTTSSTISIDYTVGPRRTSRVFMAVTYTTGGAKTVTLDKRGAANLVLSVTVSVALSNTQITALDAGAFDGQMLTIRNVAASMDALVVAGSLLESGVNRTIPVGGAATLRYSDAAAKWMTVASGT